MDQSTYDLLFFLCTILPTVIVIIILFILLHCNRDIEELILLVVMKSIISKNNLNEEASLFVCNRILSKHRHFALISISMLIISMCLQTFFSVAIFDISNVCINDPKLDCFKYNDDNQSPVNCSSLTQDDYVTCQRITAFDPERAFIGAAAAYLLFKMINVALFIVAHTMLWAARKWEGKAVRIQYGFALVCCIVVFIPTILFATLDEVKSASKKFSLTASVYLQAALIAIIVMCFTLLPWETFQESEEHFRDVSVPKPKSANANEYTRLIEN